MSDQLDVGSLRVAELRKELRARGLSANGDKAELAGRLRAALSIDELDLTALDDEPDTTEVIESPTGVTESSADPPLSPLVLPPSPPPVSKKIVLNRSTITPPVGTTTPAPTSESAPAPITAPAQARPTKLVADSKSRLEMRAKRFGITSPLVDDIKEARKTRFGGATAPSPVLDAATATTLDVLKKRAERFGSSVSKIMVDVENREKLERRKAKFSTVKI